ncbi:MAG: stage 0 sporulation protein [Deltaproteobacteria bacterium]|nr:stage 0 sporulation protein [Deltaproteobacteria bacterium]
MEQEGQPSPQAPPPPEAAPALNFVGVKFQEASGVHRFDAGTLALRHGDIVVVATEHGQRLGTITSLPQALRGEAQGPVRRIVRRAESHDYDKHDRTRLRERDAMRQCLVRVRERNLQMKLIKAEQAQEGGKIAFYFSAEGRIDFRDLVRELAHVLHARIEMKQIGSRDEAKVIGAAGPCGRELCCSTWLREPGGVSVKMAKAQGLSLNPSKLAGMCGRLKCCLRYEYDTYVELGRALPSAGKKIESVKGSGVVLRQNPLKQTVLIQLEGDAGIVEASLEDLVQKKAP